jgi:hypothetical protein
MVMDPQFSPQEAELFYLLAGSKPPLANREMMLATRDVFVQAQQAVMSQLSPGIGRFVTRALMGMDGAVAEGFAKSMEPLNSAAPYYLPTLVDQYQKVANYIETTADEFLRMKVDSIIALASLLATIAIDLAIALFFPEVGLSAIASEMVIVRFLLSTIVGRLIMHLIMAAVTSVAIQEALDVIGQLVVNTELHQDWNWEETVMQAEVGLLGGAMGLVLMPVDHMLGEFLGNALVKGTDAVLGATFGTELGQVGEDVVHAAGEFTAGALVGGVHNAGHATLFNGMTGNGWSWDWGAFSGGAAQGVAGIVASGLAAGFKMATMTATLPVDQLLVRGLNESISPAVLNDIATYRPPASGGGPGDGPEGGTAVGAEAAPGETAVPPAVALLNRIDVPPGPETAYAIALRTGFVPTVGEPSENSLWARPLTASVPMAGFLVPAQTGPVLPGAVIVEPGQPAALPPGRQVMHEPAAPESAPPPYTPQPVNGQPVSGQPVAGHPVNGQPAAGLAVPSAGQQATVQPTTQATPQPGVEQSGEPGSLLDEPLPASAAHWPVLAPDGPAQVAGPGRTPESAASGNGHAAAATQTSTGPSGTPESAAAGNGRVAGVPGTGGQLAAGARTASGATAASNGHAGPSAAAAPAQPAAAALAREQQLQDLRAEQRVLIRKLSAFMITAGAAAPLLARLAEVDAAIQQHMAEAAGAASQPAPAPAPAVAPAGEHAAAAGVAAPAGPAVRNAAGVSFNTGTASSRLTAAQAAAAVPAAVTRQGGLWATVGGHSQPGFIEIHGVKWSVAEALELPSVREGLKDAEAIVLSLCDAAVPGDGVPSVARQWADATGIRVIAANQKVIVAATDVVAGQIAYGADGLPQVVHSGTWKLYEGGEERDLETPSLREVYAGLRVTALPSGPAPAELVAFASEPRRSGDEDAVFGVFRLSAIKDLENSLVVRLSQDRVRGGVRARLADSGRGVVLFRGTAPADEVPALPGGGSGLTVVVDSSAVDPTAVRQLVGSLAGDGAGDGPMRVRMPAVAHAWDAERLGRVADGLLGGLARQAVLEVPASQLTGEPGARLVPVDELGLPAAADPAFYHVAPARPEPLRYASGRVVTEDMAAQVRAEAAPRMAAQPRSGYDRPATVDDFPDPPDTGGKTSGFGVAAGRKPIRVRPAGSRPSADAVANRQRWASREGLPGALDGRRPATAAEGTSTSAEKAFEPFTGGASRLDGELVEPVEPARSEPAAPGSPAAARAAATGQSRGGGGGRGHDDPGPGSGGGAGLLNRGNRTVTNLTQPAPRTDPAKPENAREQDTADATATATGRTTPTVEQAGIQTGQPESTQTEHQTRTQAKQEASTQAEQQASTQAAQRERPTGKPAAGQEAKARAAGAADARAAASPAGRVRPVGSRNLTPADRVEIALARGNVAGARGGRTAAAAEQAAFDAADQAFRDRLTAAGKPERALNVEEYLHQIQAGQLPAARPSADHRQATGDDMAPRSARQRADVRVGKQPQPRDRQAERQQDQLELAELQQLQQRLELVIAGPAAESSAQGAARADQVAQARETLQRVQAQITALTTRLTADPGEQSGGRPAQPATPDEAGGAPANGDPAAKEEAGAQAPVTSPRPRRTRPNRRYVPALETVPEETSAEVASASRRVTVEEEPEEPSALPALPADSPHVLEPENETPAQFAARVEPDLPADVHLMAVDGGLVLYRGEAPAEVVPSLTARSAGGLVVSVDSSVTSPAVIRQVLASMPASWRDQPVEVWLPGPADGRALSPAQAQRIRWRLFGGIGGRFALSFPATGEQTPTEFVAQMQADLPADVHVMPADGGVVVYRGDPPADLVPFLAAEPAAGGLTVTVHPSVTSRAVVRQVLTNLPAGRRQPVEVQLPGPASGGDLTRADVERIASRLVRGVSGQFTVKLPGHPALDSAAVRYRPWVEEEPESPSELPALPPDSRYLLKREEHLVGQRGNEVPGSGTPRDQARDDTGAQSQDPDPAARHQRALAGLLDLVPAGVIGDQEPAPLPRGAGALVIGGQLSLTDHALVIGGEGYTPAEIARLARAHPGQAVVLVAANAGFTRASGSSFADDVAALAPGTDVIAPESTAHAAGDRLVAMTFDPAAMSIRPGWHAHSQGQPALPLGVDLRSEMSGLGVALSTVPASTVPASTSPAGTPAASTPSADAPAGRAAKTGNAPEESTEAVAMERGLPGDVRVRPVDGGGVVIYRAASPETLVPSLEPRPDGGRTIIVDSSVTSRAVIRQVLANLPAEWRGGPVDVRLAGRADGRPLGPADIERISDRLFDGIDGQFALALPEEAVADHESAEAVRERVLSEVAWSARAWKQPVEAVVADEQKIQAEAASKVSGLRKAAEEGDAAALVELAYWQVIKEASTGVAGQAGQAVQARSQNERVAVAAAQAVAGMQGEESGEQVSAAVADQFAAGAGAFGWAGYARAWMDVKQAEHENALAAAQNVLLPAYQSARQAYERVLGGAPGTGSAAETPEAAGRASRAEQAAEQAFAQHVKDAANALTTAGSLAEVVGAAALADRIWEAVAETETADAAGVLSRAATLPGTAATLPGTAAAPPDTAETGSDLSDSWEDVSGTSESWENVSDTSESWENVSDRSEENGPEPAENGDTTEGSAGTGVTWLRAPGDQVPHLQARNAAPRGKGVRTLLAHSDGGDVIDGNGWLTPEQVAARLGLPLVSSSPDGRFRRRTRSP